MGDMDRTSVFFLFTSTTSTFTNKYDRLWPRKIYCILMGKCRQMPMFTPPKVATRHYSILNLCVSGWRFPCEFEHFLDSNDCIVRLWHILWHILQRNKSFFLAFLLVGPEIHNSTHSFLSYHILNFVYNIFFKISVTSSNVFCSWYGFPWCYKCNSSKTNWDVPELFSISSHPTTRRCSRAICFLNSYLF